MSYPVPSGALHYVPLGDDLTDYGSAGATFSYANGASDDGEPIFATEGTSTLIEGGSERVASSGAPQILLSNGYTIGFYLRLRETLATLKYVATFRRESGGSCCTVIVAPRADGNYGDIAVGMYSTNGINRVRFTVPGMDGLVEDEIYHIVILVDPAGTNELEHVSAYVNGTLMSKAASGNFANNADATILGSITGSFTMVGELKHLTVHEYLWSSEEIAAAAAYDGTDASEVTPQIVVPQLTIPQL